MIIFDGRAFAQKKLQQLKNQLVEKSAQLKVQPKIAAVLFQEDAGSVLYTEKKRQAAEEIGLSYQIKMHSIHQSLAELEAHIKQLNQDESVTGIIIQKPWKKTYLQELQASSESFKLWWQQLVALIDPNKDVDGLHPQSLAAIKNDTWQQQSSVLPATCQAVWDILQEVPEWGTAHKQWQVVIIGRSQLLGLPLFYLCQNRGLKVDLIGQKGLAQRRESGLLLQDADVVVSATGHNHLITADMLKPGVAIIDAGEPQPDVDFAQIETKASFITPVPGGVGPVTVACLMENGFKLCLRQ